MFYGLATHKLNTGDLNFEHLLKDIQTLNEEAMRGTYDVTAISFHAYAYIHDKYALLPHGASIGDNYGPIVVSRDAATPDDIPNLKIAIPAPKSRIVVIDRPNSPQSVILAGRVLPVTGGNAGEDIDLANEVLGNGFLSRLNQDIREDKGWSYGVRSSVPRPLGERSFTIVAPVQSDRTGDSLKLLIADMTSLASGKTPVNSEELQRVTEGNIRGLPNRYETMAQILSAIVLNDRLGRPDDYIAKLPTLYRSFDAAALDKAARSYLGADNLVFVVVGDRKVIDKQLQGIGLPIEYAPVDTSVNTD